MTIARDTPSHTDLENGPALSCTDAATERISHGCLLDVASNLRRQRKVPPQEPRQPLRSAPRSFPSRSASVMPWRLGQRLRMASMSWALPMRLRPRMRSSPARL